MTERAAPFFKICDCGKPHTHGHFHIPPNGDLDPGNVSPAAFCRKDGRQLLEDGLKGGIISAPEKEVLLAQLEASEMPEDVPEEIAKKRASVQDEFGALAAQGIQVMFIGPDDIADLLDSLRKGDNSQPPQNG